jgi:2-amino-4-deoxychorismate synthase
MKQNTLPSSLRGENYAIIAQGNHARIYPGELVRAATIEEMKSLQTPWKVVTFLTPSSTMREAGRESIGEEAILAYVSSSKDVQYVTREKLFKMLTTHGDDNFSLGEFIPNVWDEQYREKVVEAQNHIKNGDICQVVLARNFSAPITGLTETTPLAILARLLQIRWTYMTALFRTSDHAYAFASPERHLTIRNNRATVNPIAGTMKIDDEETFDERLTEFLMQDEKERQELTMLLDEGTKMIARFCPHGHIEWPFLRETGAVIHTEYIIAGKIVPRTHAIDALRRTLNAPTLTGSPIHEAAKIIARLEEITRGYYGWVFGVYRNHGNLDSAIAIRGVHLDFGKEIATITAGAGITQESQPQNEADETRNKTRWNISVLSGDFHQRPAILHSMQKKRHERAIQLARNAFLSRFHFWEQSKLEPCPELLWKEITILNFEDDFAYILWVMMESLGARVQVEDYDDYRSIVDPTLPDMRSEDILVFGGGPGDINDFSDGKMKRLREILAERGDTPILGICLGCQAICQHLGLEVRKLEESLQWVQRDVTIASGEEKVGHYNSFAGFGEKEWCEILTKTDGSIDMIHAPNEKMLGVQFHPESVMTQNGREILKNILLKLIK